MKRKRERNILNEIDGCKKLVMCSFPYRLSQFVRISFNFLGLYPSIVRALSILMPLKRGRGVLSFISSVVAGWIRERSSFI